MTDTFNEGDLIEATHGEQVIRARVDANGGNPGVPIAQSFYRLATLQDEGFTIRTVEKAAPALPTEPGTVIAIGDWWLVKLRPYAPGIPAAWEFLPVPESVKPSLIRSGQHDQCVYGNEWVQAEVEQEGGFTIIAAPGVAS